MMAAQMKKNWQYHPPDNNNCHDHDCQSRLLNGIHLNHSYLLSVCASVLGQPILQPRIALRGSTSSCGQRRFSYRGLRRQRSFVSSSRPNHAMPNGQKASGVISLTVLSVQHNLDLMPKSLTREQVTALLLEKRIVSESGCWEWTGALDGRGYGVLHALAFTNGERRLIRVHRLAAHIWNGLDLASELLVCHKCDNPPCFNPAHLFEGSDTANMADARRKNRMFIQFRMDDQGREFCSNGHLITPENTCLPQRSDGRKCRQCRICYNEYMRAFNARQNTQA